MLRKVVLLPAIRSLLGILPGRHLPYVAGFTVLSRKEEIRRPCVGYRCPCVRCWSTMRRVSSRAWTRDEIFTLFRSWERHRRRATGSQPSLFYRGFLTFRAGI